VDAEVEVDRTEEEEEEDDDDEEDNDDGAPPKADALPVFIYSSLWPYNVSAPPYADAFFVFREEE